MTSNIQPLPSRVEAVKRIQKLKPEINEIGKYLQQFEEACYGSKSAIKYNRNYENDFLKRFRYKVFEPIHKISLFDEINFHYVSPKPLLKKAIENLSKLDSDYASKWILAKSQLIDIAKNYGKKSKEYLMAFKNEAVFLYIHEKYEDLIDFTGLVLNKLTKAIWGDNFFIRAKAQKEEKSIRTLWGLLAKPHESRSGIAFEYLDSIMDYKDEELAD